MTPPHERDLKKDLETVREYVKMHKDRHLLASALSSTDDKTSVLTWTEGWNDPKAAVLPSATPENPNSFIVLLGENGEVLVSGNAQVYIFHLYRLHTLQAGSDPHRQEWNWAEDWQTYFNKLVKELLDGQRVFHESSVRVVGDFVREIFGDGVSSMK